MRKIISKPHFFFIFLAAITLFCGILNKDATIQVALYGSLVDVKIWTVSLFSVLFFILISVNYASLYIIKKPAKKWLTILHIILQIIALIPFFYFVFQANVPRTYEEVSAINIILVMSFAIFILATIVHLINFVMSLIAKKD
ncbi:MAG: hypothetical protein JXR05_12910 [Flavobacteriaceae bacterium]